MVGPAMLVGRWLPPRRVWLASASVVLLGCCTLSAFRASHWKNNLALWTYGTAHDPTNPTMQMNLANALRAAGQVEEGCRRLVVTLELLERRPVPDTAAKTHYNLGNCYLKARRYDASIRHYLEATAISGGEIHQARHNLVVALIEGGRLQQAVIEARYFTRANPNEAAAWRVLGVAQAHSGRMNQAVKAFEASLRLEPHHERTRRMLNDARNQAGRPR